MSENRPTKLDSSAQPIIAPTETGDVDDGAELLLFETSPYGNFDAIVQTDGRTVYFYLNPHDVATNTTGQPPSRDPAFQTKACWVRNLQPGPYVINEDEMRAGLPPQLPRTHCRSASAGRLPAANELSIVWFEEGNGAALLESSGINTSTETSDHATTDYHSDLTTQTESQTIAIIPPWSGIEGFHGYAADCGAESALCWPMPDSEHLRQRIRRAAEFWNSFRQSPDPFAQLQQKILAAYETCFFPVSELNTNHSTEPTNSSTTGNTEPPKEPAYFSIGGERFPPRGMVHYQTSEQHILATVAMSLCPQPNVELHSNTPDQLRRIELAIALPRDADQLKIEAAKNGLAKLSGYPWRNFRWLAAGHTVQLEEVFADTNVARLVAMDSVLFSKTLRLPDFRNDPIQLLWLVAHH